MVSNSRVYPDTKAHREFLAKNLEKVKALQQQYMFLDFKEEVNYFSNSSTIVI